MLLSREFARAEAIEFLEERLSEYPLVPEGEPDPLKARYDHNRYFFGGKFPALTVSEASTEGPESNRLPGTITLVVSIVYPSLKGRMDPQGFFNVDENRDSRAEANRLTRRVFSQWEVAFLKDRELRSRVLDMRVASTQSGDTDRLGNFNLESLGRGSFNVLWRYSGVIVFET